jgi:hypothetical protein
MTKRPKHDLDRLAIETEQLLDDLDPAAVPWEDTSDLRAIGEAKQAAAETERRLALAVSAARLNGRSWARIGMVLGTTKQAAQQRFGHLDASATRSAGESR